ncbi:MAG TPA: hypothetical protein VHF58_01225 [Solirubrobacterales bacterium]|nr:hypothetical protein [Solirubrobacterales bacterium]
MTGLVAAISNGDVILIVVFLAIPLAAAVFIGGAGRAYKEVGKGGFGLELESDAPKPLQDSATSAALADEELRQLVQAKAYRQEARGEEPLDVDAEVERLRDQQREAAAPSRDAALRDEVRQLVIARNERRGRQGKEPLDVEAEVERQLRDLENLGQ